MSNKLIYLEAIAFTMGKSFRTSPDRMEVELKKPVGLVTGSFVVTLQGHFFFILVRTVTERSAIYG